MAAKGSVAKVNIAEKLATAFGEDYIGEVDKKHYIWADDGGERVQIAIAMTCPKVFIEGGTPSTSTSVKNTADLNISQEEIEKVQDLMRSLNIDI